MKLALYLLSLICATTRVASLKSFTDNDLIIKSGGFGCKPYCSYILGLCETECEKMCDGNEPSQEGFQKWYYFEGSFVLNGFIYSVEEFKNEYSSVLIKTIQQLTKLSNPEFELEIKEIRGVEQDSEEKSSDISVTFVEYFDNK